jgi:thioredoxin-like negative regulator of GroEL
MVSIATLNTIEAVTEAISQSDVATALILSVPDCSACKRLIARVGRAEEDPRVDWVKVDLDQVPQLLAVLGLQLLVVPHVYVYWGSRLLGEVGPQTTPAKVLSEVGRLVGVTSL